jgi:hypothetical protein
MALLSPTALPYLQGKSNFTTTIAALTMVDFVSDRPLANAGVQQ